MRMPCWRTFSANFINLPAENINVIKIKLEYTFLTILNGYLVLIRNFLITFF
jgi:hypothetical protein